MRSSANFAHAAVCIGHYAEADSFLARCRGLASESVSYVSIGAYESTALFLDWARAHWTGLAERANTLATEMNGFPAAVAEAELVVGLLHLADGEIETATGALTTAVEAAMTAGAIPTMAAAAGALARIELADGDAVGARERATDGLAVIRRKGIWAWTGEIADVAVEALLADGDMSTARQVTADLAHGLGSRDAPNARTSLAVCHALILEADGKRRLAAHAFSRAERSWLRLPRPYAAARAREGTGRCLATHDSQRARELLVASLAFFEERGASWDAARVRATLRALDLAPARGGRRERFGTRLSPREREVARLAAAGRTNREIAAILVLSPRTIEDHVASAIRKLGVGSRRELAVESSAADP